MRKIGTTAATYSWYVTMAFVSFVMVFGHYSGRQYAAAEIFGLMMLTMIASMLVANFYLSRKGDIE